MLEREVVGSSFMRRHWLAATVAATALAAGSALWLAITTTATTLVLPTPPVVIEHTAPAVVVDHVTAPAPAPPPPAPAPPPAAATRCVDNIATVGVPLTDNALGELPYHDSFSPGAPRVALDDTGCAIAIELADALSVTWDGGQTFARYPIDRAIDAPSARDLAVTTARVALLRGNALGIVHPGDAAITWRALDALAVPPATSKADDDRYRSHLHLATAGAWLAVLRTHNEPVADDPPSHPLDPRLVGFTDDDGATWRYMPPGLADAVAITTDGRLWTEYTEWVGAGVEGPGDPVTHRAITDIARTRWTRTSTKPGLPALHYRLEIDRSWGCGSSEKLVAYRGARAIATLASDLRDGIVSNALAQNAVAAYALYDGQLHRLVGTHSQALGETEIHDFIGVDRYGALIASDGPLLLRWSEAGGWRVLWSAIR